MKVRADYGTGVLKALVQGISPKLDGAQHRATKLNEAKKRQG